MKNIFLLALLTLFNQSDEDFKFAIGLFNDGMYKLAREEFLNFARANPESELLPDAKYFAAECLYREEQYKAGIEEFKLVRRLYPKFSVQAAFRIGISYYNIGEIDSGLTVFYEVKDEKPDEACYWLGEGYFKLKKYEKAIDYYQRVKHGKYKEYALYSIGYSVLELKNYDLAIQYLNQVTQEDLILDAEFLLAKAYYEKGDYEETIPRLKKIKGKYEAEANFLLGEIYYSLSEFDKAIQAYSQCKTPLGTAGLGKTYYTLRDYTKALEAYKTLLNYPRYEKDAIEWIGRIYYAQKRYDKVIKWFEAEGSYTARLMIANAYYEKADYNTAYSIYKLLYEETNEPETLYRMALSLYKLGKYKEAKNLLATYAGEDANVFLLLGEIAYREKRYADALEHYTLASESESAQKAGWLGMTASLLALRRVGEAYKVSKKLVGKYPRKDTYYEFANVAYLNKKYAEAVKYYSKCGEPYAFFQVGTIYFETGDYQSSIDGFEKFLKAYPLHELASKAKYHIALAYRKQGYFEQSREVLVELLQEYPGSPLVFDAKCTMGDNFYDEGKYGEAESVYRDALESLGLEYDETALRPIYGILDSKLELEGLPGSISVANAYIERLKGTTLADRIRIKIGDICYNEAKFEEAIKYYTQVEDINLKPSAYYSTAKCYKVLDKQEDAIRTLQDITEKFPNSSFAPVALYELGKIYYQAENYEKAEEIFKSLIKKYPAWEHIGEAKLQLILCSTELEYYEKAETELRELLKVEDDPAIIARAKLELGKLLALRGALDEAEIEFNAVLDSGIMDLLPEARFMLGKLYFQLEKYQEALRTCLKVKHLYSDNKFVTPALYKAAQCEELLEDKEEAKRFYKQVIERDDYPELSAKSKEALKRLK